MKVNKKNKKSCNKGGKLNIYCAFSIVRVVLKKKFKKMSYIDPNFYNLSSTDIDVPALLEFAKRPWKTPEEEHNMEARTANLREVVKKLRLWFHLARWETDGFRLPLRPKEDNNALVQGVGLFYLTFIYNDSSINY